VRTIARVVLTVAALVAVGGPWTLRWHDDVRELEIPAPRLREEAAAVQGLFGDVPGRATYITHGTTVRTARHALAAFQAWYAARVPHQPIASLGLMLPTGDDYDALAANLAGLEDFPSDLRRELERHGFTADSFEPFARDWDAWRAASRPSYEAVVTRLAGTLRGPLSLLMSVSGRLCWFASVGPATPSDPPPELSTVSVHQLQNLNRLFSRYRISALRLSSIGLVALGLSVLALYGVTEGWRIFAVPAGACLFAFGLLGVLGHTLNLFHLLGAFLGVCLSHNYAIFSAENARRGEESPPSVRLSALTTAASFGVLALSHIPVVAALGLTVALIVLTALVIVELEPLAHRSPPEPHTPGRS
jgi:predicted exporter